VRVGQGDAVAFAELYDDTAPAVFGLVRSIVPDPAQAERTTLAVYR
jgi:RNA polymerase sigma-70 factor (ECF subfamily)